MVTFFFRRCYYLFGERFCLFICLVFIFSIFVCFSDSSFSLLNCPTSGSPNVVKNTK